MINIYTDGACSGNPGKGGWGVVILDNDKEVLLNLSPQNYIGLAPILTEKL